MHTEPEDIYEWLSGVLADAGYDLDNGETDYRLGELCEALTPVNMPEDRGPAYWQCFTKEANEAMEAAFQDLVAGLKSGEIRRLDLVEAINDAMHKIGDGRSTGHWDTEPQAELAARLNPVLDELGYKEISRWDW